MRGVLATELANGGFQVVITPVRDGAMNVAELMHSDLVITDMPKSGMEGIETIMALAAHDSGLRLSRCPATRSEARGISCRLRNPWEPRRSFESR